MTSPYDVTTNLTSSKPTIFLSDDGSIRGLEELSGFLAVVLKSLVFFILWVIALLGNVLVVVVINRSRRVQSTTNFFVISLAFSDITLMLLTAPFICIRVVMQEWAFGDAICRLVRFVQFSSMSTTSFVLVAICIDRFYTIVYPLSFKITRSTAKKMIIAAWVASAIISSLCLYFFNYVEVRGLDPLGGSRHVCPTFIPAQLWSGVFYAVLCIIGQYVFPSAIVIIGYSRLVCYILSARSCARNGRRAYNLVPRAKVKMVKMLTILTCVTFSLYLPFYTTQFVYCFSFSNFLSADVFISAFWLVSASAAVKPIIYACGNSNFWRGCKEVLCMSTMRCYRLSAYTVTNASTMSKRNYVGVLDLSKDVTDISVDSAIEPFYTSAYSEKVAWNFNGSLPSTTF